MAEDLPSSELSLALVRGEGAVLDLGPNAVDGRRSLRIRGGKRRGG